MEISAGAKRRFAKDTGVPIHIVKEPYFSYLIDLYDEFYGSKLKYRDFKILMERVENEEAFFKESQRIIDDIVKKISSKPEYIDKYNGRDFDFGVTTEYSKRNIYTRDFNRTALISIDLKQANFQSMQYVDEAIFDFSPNFETYILNHTQYSYFVKSKHLRQVIFGNLNPKRQQSVQKKIMVDILHFFEENLFGINPDNAYLMSTDEIILLYEEHTEYDRETALNFVRKIEKSIHEFNIETGRTILACVQLFELFRLDPHDIFVKRVITSTDPPKIEIKHAPAYFVPQVIKYLTREPVCDNDLVFYHENQVCRFLEPLTFESEGV